MADTQTLYLIPGTGTDWRIFTPQLEQFTNIIVPEWIAPLDRKESLESYAKRFAETIDTSSAFALGGLSLGGMLAQQLALLLNPQAVILIASCSTSKALPLSKRFSGRLTRALPDAIVKALFYLFGLMVSFSTLRHNLVYARMLQEMSPSLVRWQSGAATKWKLKRALAMPVFHIHGSKDPIIPLKNVKPTQVIEGGGHVIGVTHSEQVNAFIAQSLLAVEKNSVIFTA